MIKHGVAGMGDKLNWATTDGAPHLLLAEALLPRWRGVEGWTGGLDGGDVSDFARLIRLAPPTAVLEVGQGEALAVLSGGGDPVAWLPASDSHGGLLVESGGADEDEILAVLAEGGHRPALEDAAELVWRAGPGIAHRLFDASAPEGETEDDEPVLVELAPGRYGVRSADFDEEGISFTVREIRPLG